MITKEQVLLAYKKCKMKPIRNHFVKDNCACPIGAMMLAGPAPLWNPGDKYYEYVLKDASSSLNIPYNFLRGLAAGFDGVQWDPSRHDADGYNLGVELNRELIR